MTCPYNMMAVLAVDVVADAAVRLAVGRLLDMRLRLVLRAVEVLDRRLAAVRVRREMEDVVAARARLRKTVACVTCGPPIRRGKDTVG